MGAADRDEGGEAHKAPADAEVVRVVDGRLGAQRPIELPVLLDPGRAVLDLERWLGAGPEDPRPGGCPAIAQDAVLEQDLQLLGPAQIELVGDDLLEEGAAMEWAVEDLGAADLELEDGELVAVAGVGVSLGEGEGRRPSHRPDEALDCRGRQAVAGVLEGPPGVDAGKAVVEGLVSRYGDPPAGASPSCGRSTIRARSMAHRCRP